MNKRNVINMALDIMGIDPVNYEASEITAQEKKAGRWYDRAAAYCLDQADWIEAVENTTFTTEAAGTNIYNDEWEYMYDLPSDSLRVLDIDLDANAEYIVQGSKLYTNYYNASVGINCRYIKDIRAEVTSSLQYSEMMGEAVATRIAFNMSKIGEKGGFLEAFNDILIEAITNNMARERWKHGHEEPWWTDVDRYHNSDRNRMYY